MQLQVDTTDTKKTQGRPEDQEMAQHFIQLCQWLELEAGSELYTVAGAEVYTVKRMKHKLQERNKRMKQKLQEHYGEHVFLQRLMGVKMFCALEIWQIILLMIILCGI